jgi:hypothetical protein
MFSAVCPFMKKNNNKIIMGLKSVSAFGDVIGDLIQNIHGSTET